jgi:hypothetical protein
MKVVLKVVPKMDVKEFFNPDCVFCIFNFSCGITLEQSQAKTIAIGVQKIGM